MSEEMPPIYGPEREMEEPFLKSAKGTTKTEIEDELPIAFPVSSNKEPTEKKSVLLQIEAPVTMEAGYVLLVECNENNYRVKVPEGGVYEGQVFQAEGKLRSSPILGGWRDGLFDCFAPTEEKFCFGAWCATPFAFACLMEPIKMDCFFRRDSKISHPTVFYFMCLLGTVNTILYLILNKQSFTIGYQQGRTGNYSRQPVEQPDPMIGNVFTVLIIYTMALYVAIRYFTRLKYKIPGHLCFDCLAVKFCSCCVALQIFRHMKASGNTPSFSNTTKYAKAELASRKGQVKVEAEAHAIDTEIV